MTAVTASPRDAGAAEQVTPEQMLRLPDDGRLYELVDGHLVEKPMSDLAQFVANNLKDELVLWGARVGAGRSFVEATFRCFGHDPAMVRRPDVAFISRERLLGYQLVHGHFTFAPDLAVEVVSPGDEVYELDRKIAEYFRAGVRAVWIINPEQRAVRIHHGPGDVAERAGDVELADEAILPGFRCPLSVLFAAPPAAQP